MINPHKFFQFLKFVVYTHTVVIVTLLLVYFGYIRVVPRETVELIREAQRMKQQYEVQLKELEAIEPEVKEKAERVLRGAQKVAFEVNRQHERLTKNLADIREFHDKIKYNALFRDLISTVVDEY